MHFCFTSEYADNKDLVEQKFIYFLLLRKPPEIKLIKIPSKNKIRFILVHPIMFSVINFLNL